MVIADALKRIYLYNLCCQVYEGGQWALDTHYIAFAFLCNHIVQIHAIITVTNFVTTDYGVSIYTLVHSMAVFNLCIIRNTIYLSEEARMCIHKCLLHDNSFIVYRAKRLFSASVRKRIILFVNYCSSINVCETKFEAYCIQFRAATGAVLTLFNYIILNYVVNVTLSEISIEHERRVCFTFHLLNGKQKGIPVFVSSFHSNDSRINFS